MDATNRSNPAANAAEILEMQRVAFMRDGAPSLTQRRSNLKKLREAVLSFRIEIERAIDADFGHRSRHETGLLELVGVIQAIDYLHRNLRRFMKPERRHVALTFRPGRAHVQYQPLGVIGILSPWNYPFSLSIVPIATALAAGNRAMLKPSEVTPRTSDVIQRMLSQAFPEGEVAAVLGDAAIGANFSALPFDHILFTGSTQVGCAVMKAASENLVPVTLELGGKCPAIIQRGHVNGRTMGGIVFGKLSNAGQTCVAPDYALVHEDDLDTFIDLFGKQVIKSYPDGASSADYTSIVNDRHFGRLRDLIEDARTKKAKIIEVGNRPEAATRARTVTPTLVVGATDDTTLMQQEIFGPILAVRTYRKIDEAIAYVNTRSRPLALYFFGDEGEECRRVLSRTVSGNVGVNNTMLHVAQDDLPFGGVGPSGMGAYHGIEGFRRMSHAKGVFVQGRWSAPNMLRAPFGRLVDRTLSFMLR